MNTKMKKFLGFAAPAAPAAPVEPEVVVPAPVEPEVKKFGRPKKKKSD